MFLIRRLIWFTTGATAGFGGAMWIRRRLLRTLDRFVPQRVQADVGRSARRFGGTLRDAVAEGRAEARGREARLRAELRPGVGGTAADAGDVTPLRGETVPFTTHRHR